jgi:hypothetical protein
MTPLTPALSTGAAMAEDYWRRALYELEAMADEEGRGKEGDPGQLCPSPFAEARPVIGCRVRPLT